MDADALPERCCARCGFLAAPSDGHGYAEADEDFRFRHWPKDSFPMNSFPQDNFPRCAVRQYDLRGEVFHEAKSAETGERDPYNHPLYREGRTFDSFKLSVIQRERSECPTFTRWWPGYSPKEHQEMLDRKWMLDREERMEKERRRFEVRLAFVIAGVGVLGAVLGAVLSNWPW